MSLSEMRPVLWGLLIVLAVGNVFFVLRLVGNWQTYAQAPRWPRLTVKADNVQLMHVMHSRESSPTSAQEFYEAIVDFRYQVNGRHYHKQITQTVASQAAADAIKAEASMSFIYNPADPAQTLETPPGPAATVGALIALIVFNSVVIGLWMNVSRFLGEA